MCLEIFVHLIYYVFRILFNNGTRPWSNSKATFLSSRPVAKIMLESAMHFV